MVKHTILLSVVAGVALAIVDSSLVTAHSRKELEDALKTREKYFQAFEKPAPEFTLQDADGKVVRLSDFRGKVVVLHFIFASCPDVCPLHAERIAEVQAMVNSTPMKDRVQFISITSDPKNDRGEVLRGYGPAHGLEAVNWTFLTTRLGQSEDATRKLAERYGHKFAVVADRIQVHGVVTHVIDRTGRWRANFHGLKFRALNLVVYINALTNEHHDH